MAHGSGAAFAAAARAATLRAAALFALGHDDAAFAPGVQQSWCHASWATK